MPKSREQKKTELTRLATQLSAMKSMVLSTTKGLKVSDVTKLRKQMRAEGAEYLVVKKTLLFRALDDAGISYPELDAVGASFAVSFGFSDEVAPARLLYQFQKEHEVVEFLGGLVGRTAYSADHIAALARLPSRHELLAKLVGSMSAPLSRFLNAASGPLRGMVQVLRAKSETGTV